MLLSFPHSVKVLPNPRVVKQLYMLHYKMWIMWCISYSDELGTWCPLALCFVSSGKVVVWSKSYSLSLRQISELLKTNVLQLDLSMEKTIHRQFISNLEGLFNELSILIFLFMYMWDKFEGGHCLPPSSLCPIVIMCRKMINYGKWCVQLSRYNMFD